jgi:hypothetical protein
MKTVNAADRAVVVDSSPAHAEPARESRSTHDLVEIGTAMNLTKSLVVAALISSVAAVSFAQEPAKPADAKAPAAATAAAKPMHHAKKRHASHRKAMHHGSANAATPAAPAASK